MNGLTGRDHTFVVCAYKESGFLSECIDSLLAQKVKSSIIISTSTPNEHISRTADLYGLELRINPAPPGIAGDWNFAYKQAGTRLITLAHQDDVYLPDYLSAALEMVNKASRPIIFFTRYGEVIGGKVYYSNLRLNVKRLLLLPMRIFRKSRFIRRRALSLGDVICCPSVMYVDLPDLEFSSDFKCCLDWHKWEELSKLKGSFLYCAKPLLHHRLHGASETSKSIQDSTRRNEDYLMFKKFWWAPVARVLARLYTKSEANNGAADIGDRV